MRTRLPIWRKSLVARLVLSFLLLSLMTVVFLGSIAFFQARRALQDSILDRLSVAATLKEDALSQWVADQTRDFLVLARLPSVQAQLTSLLKSGGSEAEAEPARVALSRGLASALAKNSAWQEILLLSARSEIVWSTEASHEGNYRIRSRYFTEGRLGDYVQKVYPSPITFIPTITIATPVLDGDSLRGGVLALHLNLERMDEIILDRTGLGVSSESYLVDRFNVLISGMRFGREEFPRGVRSMGINKALEGVDGSGLYLSYRNKPVIGVYRWIDDLEVALLTEMSRDEGFAPARRLAWVILTVGLLIAVALTLGIYLLALQIARPILNITRAAVEVSDGDLTAQAAVLTEDEVGVLARTFNQMTGKLRALYSELEDKNAELQRFAYTVSHDLKSPLITIRGFLGLLERDVASGDAERLAEDIEKIQSAAETMGLLLEDLLELSRVGRLVNQPEEVALGALVRETLDLVAGSIAERGVEVSVEPDLPNVYGDRMRLLEVLQNLVENAVKFMADQPRPHIEIGAREEGEEVVCFVRDNGRGIDPRYHQKIFGLFDQLDQNDEGTGIGLALIQRIVEVHNGRIWVESQPGQGATFFFTLQRYEDP